MFLSCHQPTRAGREDLNTIRHKLAQPLATVEVLRARLLERSQVNPLNGCREWTRGRLSGGYGRLPMGSNKTVEAHRISYAAFNGVIPQGMHVLHRCDNPPCIEPAHLFLGTPLDNARDKIAKGRSRVSRKPRKPLTPEQRQAICADLQSASRLAAQFSVTRRTIHRVRRAALSKVTGEAPALERPTAPGMGGGL